MARRERVLVAMSGGVDSSVAAALLVERGYDVMGCFMRLGSPGETLDEIMPDPGACTTPTKIGHQGCCSINDAADARLVAAHLGIPLYVCNFKRDFGRIIDYFVDEYAEGRTPNPCVRCNDWLKFGKLHEYATSVGASFVASGHYARTVNCDGGLPMLARGHDRKKDQSYVLFGVPLARLSSMMLPIGEYEKSDVRQMARERGLPVSDKPDSQEICFVPDNDYAGLVERRRPDLASTGEVRDTTGKVLGTHEGQHRFTIGQRRGVGIALGHKLFVVSRDAGTNSVVVGSRADTLVAGAIVGEANELVRGTLNAEWTSVRAQYRAHGDDVHAQVRLLEPTELTTPSGRAGRFEIRFAEPQEAVAPGQALVLYDAAHGDTVLAGGWIREVTSPKS